MTLRALITGGAGFIGSHLSEKLIELKNTVIVYDNFDTYYPYKERNIRHLTDNEDFNLVKADILDYEQLRNVVKGVDIVFHLAAQPGVRFSLENPARTSEVNVTGTLNVLEACKEAKVEKVIFASSSSVYGQPKYLPVDENHPSDPVSIYGASKLTAENYCKVYGEQFKLPVVMLRYYTVYGPRQRPDMAIHKWTKAIFKGMPISIYGDGDQTRDFTFINDIIDGTLKAVEAEKTDGEIFNLGGGSRVSVNDVIHLLIDLTEAHDVQIVHEPPKPGDVQDTHADITKARKMLGYTPTTNLKEGLKIFVEWYKNNLS